MAYFAHMNKAFYLHPVEEKFGEQNFRVLSEMRILAEIGVAILDFGRVSLFFNEFLGFRVFGCRF